MGRRERSSCTYESLPLAAFSVGPPVGGGSAGCAWPLCGPSSTTSTPPPQRSPSVASCDAISPSVAVRESVTRWHARLQTGPSNHSVAHLTAHQTSPSTERTRGCATRWRRGPSRSRRAQCARAAAPLSGRRTRSTSRAACRAWRATDQGTAGRRPCTESA